MHSQPSFSAFHISPPLSNQLSNSTAERCCLIAPFSVSVGRQSHCIRHWLLWVRCPRGGQSAMAMLLQYQHRGPISVFSGKNRHSDNFLSASTSWSWGSFSSTHERPRLHNNQLATPIGPTLTSDLFFYCPPYFRPKPLVVSLPSPIHPSHGRQLSLLGTKVTLFPFKNHKDSLSNSATGDPQAGTNPLPSSYLASRNYFILHHFLTFSSFGPLLTSPHPETALFPPTPASPPIEMVPLPQVYPRPLLARIFQGEPPLT